MKIELDSNAAEACCTITITLAVLALAAILVFGIGGCVRQVNKDRMDAGLVEKQNDHNMGTHWTRP